MFLNLFCILTEHKRLHYFFMNSYLKKRQLIKSKRFLKMFNNIDYILIFFSKKDPNVTSSFYNKKNSKVTNFIELTHVFLI